MADKYFMLTATFKKEGKSYVYADVYDDDNQIKVNGSSYTSDDHSVVWACKSESEIPGLVIYSSNYKELLPLARKIPHYGKYGFLVFEHGQNVDKGNHESHESPLIWHK